MTSLKRVVSACVAGWAPLVLAGCGGSARPAAMPPPPLSGPVPVITSVDQITRPISGYLPRPSDLEAMAAAANVLNARCMAAFGLPSIPTKLTGLDPHSLQVVTAHSRLYGFFDPTIVKTAGYDVVQLPSSADTVPTTSTPPDRQYSDARTVEFGQDGAGTAVTTYAGKPVPAGGCKAQADQQSGGTLPDMDPSSLPDGGPHLPIDDPRVIDAVKEWRACMTGRGYKVGTPYDAMTGPIVEAPVVGEGTDRKVIHSADEVAQAEADVACKESTNLIGVDVAVQATYDQAYIDSHGPALTGYRQQLEARVHTAAQIVATSQSGR